MQGTPTLQLILHAGLFVKFILLILAGFSIATWAIIVQKILGLKTASEQSRRFIEAFDSGASEKELEDAAEQLSASPFAALYRAAREAKPRGRREAISTAIARCEAVELERLQSFLTFLATTGSSCPFIGLLGTVWGIMDAFRGIGAAGSASLAVVSPAIAEALVTTAAGLVAAIPAAMAYNTFLDRVRKIQAELEDFSEEVRSRVGEGVRVA